MPKPTKTAKLPTPKKLETKKAVWGIKQIRLSLFYADTGPTSGFWEDFTGTKPSASQSKIAEGVYAEDGLYKNGHLVAQKVGNRLDLIYLLPPNAMAAGVNDLGDFTQIEDDFVAPAIAWLSKATKLQRIAFGPELLLKAKDREEAYSKLSGYLSSAKVPPSSDVSDFALTINWPRKIKFKGGDLKINRLSTWRSLQRQLILTGVPTSDPSPFPLEYFLSADLDINSDKDFSKGFTGPQAAEILRILVDAAIEISEKGEGP